MSKSFSNIHIHPESNSSCDISIENADSLALEKQERVRFAQDTRHRHWLVGWMMAIVSVWLIWVLIITMFNSQWSLNIKPEVLITLLATTTINVLGLSKIILNGLFKHTRRKRHLRQ